LGRKGTKSTKDENTLTFRVRGGGGLYRPEGRGKRRGVSGTSVCKIVKGDLTLIGKKEERVHRLGKGGTNSSLSCGGKK